MRTMKLGISDLEVPVIGVGCMRINSLTKPEAEAFIKRPWKKVPTSSTTPISTEAAR